MKIDELNYVDTANNVILALKNIPSHSTPAL